MTTRRVNVRVGLALLLASGVLAALILGIRYLRGSEAAPLAEASATVDATAAAASPGIGTATSAADAPEPAATNPLPPPTATETPLPPPEQNSRPTLQPPQVLGLPGPTPTALPLRQPAADAAGFITYLSGGGEEQPALYTLGVGASAELAQEAVKSSEMLFSSGDYFWAYPSPDGRRIAYVVPLESYSGILICELEGVTCKVLNDYSDTYIRQFIQWHPDSTNLLAANLFNLFFVNVSTGDGNVIVSTHGAGGSIDSAAVSPSGQEIVYWLDKGFGGELWMSNVDGINVQLLASIVAIEFSWSPDGRWIAFNGGDLKVMNADGSNLRTLWQGHLMPYQLPAWSPDSRTLAIVTGQEGTWHDAMFDAEHNIYLIDVESGAARPILADGSTGNIDPVWSPDGRYIAFVSNRSGAPEIWVVNADGGNLRQLTFDGKMKRYPVWRGSDR